MNFSLDHSDMLPLYKQLRNIILNDINSGVYPQGSKIPPEMELSKVYNVSRITVRSALEELTKENLLVRQQGRGTFVRFNRLEKEVNSLKSFTDICEENGYTPGSNIVELEFASPDETARELLNVDENTNVVRLERVRFADTIPVSYEVSQFTDDFSFLFNEELEGISLYNLLETKYDIIFKTSKKTIEIAFANKKMASHLNVAEGHPLILITSLAQNISNNRVHLAHTYILGDKFKLNI